jgi:hypothetical protein
MKNIYESKASDFLVSKGLKPIRFSKNEIGISETPDYRVFQDQEFAFFCEVKTVAYDTWLDKQLKDAPELTLVGGLRKDPTFNRLTSHIHKAAKQFNAVNPNLDDANVLIFVNDDFHTDFYDLVGVITGCCYTTEGEVLPIYRNFSEGRIKRDKYRIHLYLWLDERLNGFRYFFTPPAYANLDRLCSYFEIDKESIRRISD